MQFEPQMNGPVPFHMLSECPVCGKPVHVVLSARTLIARWTCLGCGAHSASPCNLLPIEGDDDNRALVPGASA